MLSLPHPSYPMGIYAIHNSVTGQCYVGRAFDLKRRWTNHRKALQRGQHYNALLQSAWAIHGSQAFRFTVLDYVEDRDDLAAAEQQWIAALRPSYNLKPVYSPMHSAIGRQEQRSGPWSAATVARFWAKVRRGDGCWEWLGSTQYGYGQFFLFKKPGTQRVVLIRAHRFSYVLAYGPVPVALLVRHTCDNRLCVRPDHLVAGTHRQNTDDMLARGRGRHAKGEASPNHKLTTEMVRAMRQRYGAGETLTALSRDYPVSYGRVSDVVHGHSWQHVDGAHPVERIGLSRDQG